MSATLTAYAAANGAKVRGGRPLPLPAWAAGAVLNKAISIPNTAGFGGSPGSYGGWAKKNTIFIMGLESGHSAGFDNRVCTFDYMQDAPTWVVRMPSSTIFTDDTPKYPDGKPAGRHVYQMAQYVAPLDCVVWAGIRFTNPNAGTFLDCDAFDMATYTWKPASGGVPYIQNVSDQNGGGVIDYDGYFHSAIFSQRLNTSTRQWESGVVTIAPGYSTYAAIRHPWATDVSGRKVFGISMGDGEGSGTDLRATVMRNNVRYPVTIASSAALTQFISDAPGNAGMDFDSINGKFLYVDWFNRRYYWIAVASDNTATMTQATFDFTGVIVPAHTNDNTSCSNTRVSYDATLKGFFIGIFGCDMLFIKTSA